MKAIRRVCFDKRSYEKDFVFASLCQLHTLRSKSRSELARPKPLDIILSAHSLDDGGDESRLEVDYPLGGLRDAEDEVLDEVGDAAVGDDEEARDGAGHALRQVVSLGGVLALRGMHVTRRRAG